MSQRGGIASGLLTFIGFVVVVLVFAAITTCGEDSESTVRFHRVANVTASDDGDCGRGGYCSGEDNRGDCRNTDQPCSDNDFSPQFDDSPVDITGNQFCVMPGSCSSQPDQGQPAPSP